MATTFIPTNTPSTEYLSTTIQTTDPHTSEFSTTTPVVTSVTAAVPTEPPPPSSIPGSSFPERIPLIESVQKENHVSVH